MKYVSSLTIYYWDTFMHVGFLVAFDSVGSAASASAVQLDNEMDITVAGLRLRVESVSW